MSMEGLKIPRTSFGYMHEQKTLAIPFLCLSDDGMLLENLRLTCVQCEMCPQDAVVQGSEAHTAQAAWLQP